ncbi:polysaccharide biosynthesis tyrosine autokinase [Neobacillus notoginsengisoli]|uniref:non-specific protein-tyrosine kinase n=1 Tax=Neobacillus notoginsengisoli TaxID=1578198 RepID=A0A417YYU4_9BACI|nr:CpsD/CapB family tyrosine-protein kinase [Neobacillus notoginsengisoli]RHW42805.1 polysaccharide biosynthesis tyrosine autokinase [Neobacillus notoginsengisoli]
MKLTNRKSSFLNKKVSLVAATAPTCTIAEQYRTIRTNYLSSIDCKNARTIMITSANGQEGKSTVAANFAISLAQQGKKVLLIDANLRNPILDFSFKVKNSIGLSNLLNGRVRFEDTIADTGIQGVDLLPSGPIPLNPAELLGSPNMESLILKSTGLYDVVLLDTFSILEVSDAKILANQCDGLIIVIQSGKTKSDDIMKVKKQLKHSKAKCLGIILNES